MPNLLKAPPAEPSCAANAPLRLDEQQAQTLAAQLKAMSHPVRLRMLDVISQGGGDICGCDIECHFALSQPTISHHLKVLRDVGLILSEARGVWVHHQINPAALDTLQDLLSLLRPAKTE